MSVEMKDKLWELLHWVWATQTQLERFIAALNREPDRPGESMTELEWRQFFGSQSFEEHLVWVTGRNLIHALDRVVDAHPELDLPGDIRETFTAGRDVHEHWREHRFGEGANKLTQKTQTRVQLAFGAGGPWQTQISPQVAIGGVMPARDLRAELSRIEGAALTQIQAE